MIFIGIDPGAFGAMAIIDEKGMYLNVIDNSDHFGIERLKKLIPGEYRLCIEKVHAMPGQGVTSMFNFGFNFGLWVGRFEALSIDYSYVTPQKWKKNMVPLPMVKELGKKGASLELARKLFPNVEKEFLARKKDHDRAEALLIAEYCRKIYTQK